MGGLSIAFFMEVYFWFIAELVAFIRVRCPYYRVSFSRAEL
jgi:hypothetical protein